MIDVLSHLRPSIDLTLAVLTLIAWLAIGTGIGIGINDRFRPSRARTLWGLFFPVNFLVAWLWSSLLVRRIGQEIVEPPTQAVLSIWRQVICSPVIWIGVALWWWLTSY